VAHTHGGVSKAYGCTLAEKLIVRHAAVTSVARYGGISATCIIVAAAAWARST